jgi:adenylate cyclase
MVNSDGSFGASLYEMWHEITLKTAKLMGADRATIFLLDEQKNEFCSIAAGGERGVREIRIPANQGIAGQVAALKKCLNIPRDFYESPRSVAAKEQERQTRISGDTLLALPLFNQKGKLIAVVQLVNKLKSQYEPSAPLSERVDPSGFTRADEERFAEFVPLLEPVLELCLQAVSAAGATATPGETSDSELRHATAEKGEMPAESAPPASNSIQLFNENFEILNVMFDRGLEATLNEMLRAVSQKAGELLNADRTTIFVFDEANSELWAVGEGAEGGLQTGIPADKGIVGEVATTKRAVNIPLDFFDDPRSADAKRLYHKTGYRTYTALAVPVLSEGGDLVAVVLFLNKLKKQHQATAPLANRIDTKSFTEADKALFAEEVPQIRLILARCRLLYAAAQKQRSTAALMEATRSLAQSSFDLDATVQLVMALAKQLTNADRSTLWILDRERDELWTTIPLAGILKEIRMPVGVGFVGRVATTGEPLNIPFDLYDCPDTEPVKKTDRDVGGYRTCSMLCVPVINPDGELIAVTQLINKTKQGKNSNYNPDNWPNAPGCWKASFNRSDLELMRAFNIQAGWLLQNAKQFAAVKQHEQIERDILRSLSYGVISADKEGHILTANESAQQLMGYSDADWLKGRSICDLIQIQEGDLAECLQAAIDAKDEKDLKQFYPEQTLISVGGEQRKINLSINAIADAGDATHIKGVLLVMDEIGDEKLFRRFVSNSITQDVASQLLPSGRNRLGGERKEVSVLFSGIRSFTSLLENLEDQEVLLLLKEYFQSMTEAVFKYGGVIEKYIGDAIMAVFGSPVLLEEHAWLAVQTAVEMRQRLVELNVRRVEDGKPAIRIGIGINSDTVLTGNIGSSQRLEFTTIGDGVNLGAYLERVSKQYGCDIIISETTYQPCADRVWARELDLIGVKGKHLPVAIYQLVALRSEEIPEEKRMAIEFYSRGREHYRNRQFAEAAAAFGQVLEISSWDKPAAIHLERCQHWLQQPPPEDWDGIWSFAEI